MKQQTISKHINSICLATLVLTFSATLVVRYGKAINDNITILHPTKFQYFASTLATTARHAFEFFTSEAGVLFLMLCLFLISLSVILWTMFGPSEPHITIDIVADLNVVLWMAITGFFMAVYINANALISEETYVESDQYRYEHALQYTDYWLSDQKYLSDVFTNTRSKTDSKRAYAKFVESGKYSNRISKGKGEHHETRIN